VAARNNFCNSEFNKKTLLHKDSKSSLINVLNYKKPTKTTAKKGGYTIANQRRPLPARVVDKTRVNNQIRLIKAKEIRVVADEGQLGIMDIESALKMAEERELDLVEISPQAEPPVCKIMDYRKFKFDEGKKERKAKKQQTTIAVKEIRMRPMIDTHDYEFKKRNARKFISNGDKVKVTIRFRGREFSRQDLGTSVLNKLAMELEDIAKVESYPKMDGRQMIMVLRAS
jgi:translation initiation factor IF-3